MNAFLSLSELHRIPCQNPVPLTQLVAEIVEVHPSGPITGGSMQTIVVRTRGTGGIFLHLYELKEAISQAHTGGVIRISSSPTAKRGLNWERSKADPSATGVLVARNHSKVEVFTAAQAAQMRITEFGFMRSTAEIERAAPAHHAPPVNPTTAVLTPAPPALNGHPFAGYAPLQQPTPAAIPLPAAGLPMLPQAVSTMQPGSSPDAAILTAVNFYIRCLHWAQNAFGPQAAPDNVRAAAGAVFQKLYT